MDEKNNKNYITEEYLDKRLTENNQVLLEAIDSMIARHLAETKKYLKEKLRIKIRAI